MAGSVELSVGDSHRQFGRLEKMRTVGVAEPKFNITGGKALERVLWICSLQFDQVAELEDGL